MTYNGKNGQHTSAYSVSDIDQILALARAGRPLPLQLPQQITPTMWILHAEYSNRLTDNYSVGSAGNTAAIIACEMMLAASKQHRLRCIDIPFQTVDSHL